VDDGVSFLPTTLLGTLSLSGQDLPPYRFRFQKVTRNHPQSPIFTSYGRRRLTFVFQTHLSSQVRGGLLKKRVFFQSTFMGSPFFNLLGFEVSPFILAFSLWSWVPFSL